MSTKPSEPARIVSLDQFRGYTVLGMFFVNFVGHFLVTPAIFKHHNTYCSYADTIMPQFFFAVGYAYRLTHLRRVKTVGAKAAYLHALWRNLGLILLGLVLYHLDGTYKSWAQLEQVGLWGALTAAFQREPFQALVHIGITALWVMPVIGASGTVRIGFACLSGVLHLALSWLVYYHWVMTRPGIDGGPLGFLTWTIPTLAGSFACDLVAPRFSALGPNQHWAGVIGRLLVWGLVLMALGYGMSCVIFSADSTGGLPSVNLTLAPPPFVPPDGPVHLWTMSQRAGSLSYLTFGAGLSLALYGLFVWACDVGRLRIGLFTTLGSNALAGYVIHGMVDDAIKPYAPKDAPLWYALACLGVFLAICYLFLRYLEKHKLYLRL